ncbi:MAG TPA: SEC-C metal-binding domain-containing protein [Phenylobacterium sp.]|jgi:preprotein translocase subunit SecA|nr:SEC-C metal-binding domain-containing protein [Phenylobacterium sp.]
MGKKRKRVRAKGPDEAHRVGPFQLARYGKLTVMSSNASAEEFEAAHAAMAERLPQVEAELEELVQSIVERIARLPPEKLLHRGWWEMAMAFSGLAAGMSDQERSLAQRMVDYVQSLIAATPRATEQAEDVSEEDWSSLKADVQSLFERVTIEYQLCRTAHLKADDPNLDMELEEFRFRAEVLWTNVRGKRFHVHEHDALLDVISPHSDELQKLFGITAEELVAEVDKLLEKFTRGLMEAMVAFEEFRDRTLTRFEALAEERPELGVDALRDLVFEDRALAADRDKVGNDLFGLGLYDVAANTSLPATLVDELSWSPGEETEFLSPGPFAGWPLRVWPTMRRPFIRLKGRAYAFDVLSLFDNLYRVLQRVIFRLDPDYRTSWNERQKAVSEALPFKYLGRLLPSAIHYGPVYYRWKSGQGPAQWHEADGLVIFDDHLIVVEVKAGAFTYTSPATDLPAHVQSLKNLVQSPASQGSRFVDYLESADEVAISDETHGEIAKLRRSDFRHVTVCAVTLDAFSDLTARAQHLKAVGIDVGTRPVWVVSVDDLRAYADLFTNPLIFLHFLEQRVAAAQSELVNLHDEMDHFGLYLAQNNYAQFADEVAGSRVSRLNFDGFGDEVDEHFASVLRGEAGGPPAQKMPARIAEIIDVLRRVGGPGASELASYILDWDGEFRDQIAAGIEEQLEGNKRLGRVRPLSTYGDVCATLQVWSREAPLKPGEGLDHTRAVMAMHGETERRLIELEYGDAGELLLARSEKVSLDGLPPEALARARQGAENVRRRRLVRARDIGKVGRNEPCPCGSGRKYKHCCRP